mgnify:FL=1
MGGGCFVFESLEETPRSLLAWLESQWITHFDSCSREHGYNLDFTTLPGKIMISETRAKIGAANKGRVRTPDMRARMSLIKQGQGKGRIKSPAEIENLRKAHGSPKLRHWGFE